MAKDNVELVALCDVDQQAMNKSIAQFEELSGNKVQTFTDMRKVLDDKNIDVVFFATPNHWHSLGTIWACQAGKDVCVEKPGSHNIFEGRKMVEAARKYKRIVQHGTQCRSSHFIREGIRKLHEGLIGDVYMARAITYKHRRNIGQFQEQATPDWLDWDKWLGPAPKKPYARVRHDGWHNLWDYGNGEIGNQGVHQLDLIRWGLKLDTHPVKIQSMGGMYVHDDAQQTPNVQVASFEFKDRNVLVTFEARHWYTNCEAGIGDKYPFVDGRNAVGAIFFGTEGYMVMPDYSSYHTFLGREREPGPSGADPRIPWQENLGRHHFENFVKAVRNRKPSDLTAEIEEGHYSSAMCHLANIAYRTGRTLTFDPASERFVDDAEANAHISRDYRAPYVVPEVV
jgi:predicted dehydrogenase